MKIVESDPRQNNNATPTLERCVAAYPARRNFKPYIQSPPKIEGVAGMIDIHCHAEHGQQDAFAVAKLASENGMRGLLYKSIGGVAGPRADTMDHVHKLLDDLHRWADGTGVTPIQAWGGYALTRDNKPPNAEKVCRQLDAGITAFWMPLSNHANTFSIVGGKFKRWDPTADPKAHSDPLPWDSAVKYGHYALDERGKLKPEYDEAIRMIADHGRAFSFGHCTHPEIWEIARLLDKLKFKRAFIDHPFSPFVNLSVAQMKELATVGITFNFTYDELSPMMGIDPNRMYQTIRTVGVDHFTLSSDAGDTLFPNSVEALRQISGYMIAYGMGAAEIDRMCRVNPARIVGA